MAKSGTTLAPARSCEDVAWRVAPGWEGLLLGPQGLRWEEWRQSGRLRVIKDGPHRTVSRVELSDGRAVYIKHYRAEDWRSAARHLLRDNPSRREWRQAEALARYDIPTITPVALGERRRLGVVLDSYLVTQAIPGARSLLEWTGILRTLSPGEARPLKRRLLRAAARLCATLHQAGARHDDLHADNILTPEFDTADSEAPPIHLIDVPSVRISRRLDWPASRQSLAMLAVGLMDHTTPGERLLFLREYFARRPELKLCEPDALRRAADETFAATRRAALAIAAGRDRRLLGRNKNFRRVRGAMGEGYSVSEVSAQTLAALVERPAAVLQAGIEHPVKLSHSSVVVRSAMEVGGQTVEAAYKRTRPKSLLRRLAGELAPNRRLRGWLLGHALITRGIRTPRPLAVVQTAGWRGETYLAAEWIAGLDLHSYLWQVEMRPPQVRDAVARTLAMELGKLLGRMHAWNVSHRDLKANNLLIAEGETPQGNASVTPWLVDLDGVRIERFLSFDRRARDLARLFASLRRYRWIPRGAYARFLRAYLRSRGMPSEDGRATTEARTLGRGIVAHAARIRAEW